MSNKYTEAVSEDTVLFLKDGIAMTVEEILMELNKGEIMPDDNNTSGDTAGYTGMGASCGVCGAWVQDGQAHICHQPSYPPYIQPQPSPPPTYAQPATFPQWIDPSVLERIATALEKIADSLKDKDAVECDCQGNDACSLCA